MAGQSQKLKILYLMNILLTRTDEEHLLSAKDLCDALAEYGIRAERKSIYADVEALQDYGLDVIQQRGKNPGYYIGERDFELAELKLLVDAVQSSKFITQKKSEELIRKLEAFTSRHKAKELQRQVFICNRSKTENEKIYYSVDDIHMAILQDVQIQFQYTEWTIKKELELRKEGAFYVVSPWALTWDDENYYLIAYDSDLQQMRHYRVDKMRNVSLRKERRQGEKMFQDFDLALFSKRTFSMFGGEEQKVSLICNNSLVGVILDRFGKDVMLIPVDKERFRIHMTVTVSSQFFGWLTGLGKDIQLEGPTEVRQQYVEYIAHIMKGYQ